jgi:hypothetical protein
LREQITLEELSAMVAEGGGLAFSLQIMQVCAPALTVTWICLRFAHG